MTKPEKAKAEIVSEETLSDGWTRLSRFMLDYTDSRGVTHRLDREIFHSRPAATILLYDRKKETVVLIRQFRMPAFLDGHSGWMIEAPAGLLDGDEPDVGIRREAMEETGFHVRDTRFLFKAYTSPGAVRELVHFFAAPIDTTDRVTEGGGLAEEHEDIEVLEIPLREALAMIENGEIFDAKTIMLLQWAQLNWDRLG